jgi:8-oxo-dGTP pyrophosphatase MutT (NUDIX family)
MAARLREALAGPLPGLDAQLRMAPSPRTGWDPKLFPEGARDGAGLVLLCPVGEVLHVPLTVRGAELRTHTGQVSLPGGRVDEGESIEAAALREATEEIGVIPGSVEVLGRLTKIHIPVSGYVLHPVVGIAHAQPDFRRAEWEVARILEVPLTLLADPAIVKREQRTRTRDGQAVLVDVPYFDIEGEKVWGATAMILSEFLAVLKGLD